LSRDAGSVLVMVAPGTGSPGPEALHEVVPARAVLTELARGFLLVREADRERAIRFAVTFLKERAEPVARPEPAAVPHAAPAQWSLGRFPRGAVEKLDPRGPR